eukprot:TRINITY_DN18521_c0_g1_i1.p1 TRINITY_DN18521_c0_g1~~TRINITY_DN18521_c0_g1_i1.p1  ORF type:complete len:126 (+),score=35.13 TRINITY_DN18521_c0_g1_i1:273-650(+)
MSSCLYTTAIVVGEAGYLAPASLIGVSMALLLYRGVYAEMGMAVPFNGGVYSAAINTFSKRAAAVLAMFSVLSYVATCVMSARAGCVYLFGIWGESESDWVDLATVGVIVGVAALNYWGLNESVV